MPVTERDLLSLLARLKDLHTDISAARPAIAAVDSPWDETLTFLDDAISAFGLAVYLASEALTDADAVDSGDATRLPSGEVVPVQPDSRQ